MVKANKLCLNNQKSQNVLKANKLCLNIQKSQNG